MPVVAAREGWSLRGGPCTPAAGSPARGERVVYPCPWSLLGRGGQCRGGQCPSCCRFTSHSETECLPVPWVATWRGSHWRETRALMLRVHRPRGDGLSLRAGRCPGGVVAEGWRVPSCCAFTGHSETEHLTEAVVAAREGWSLRGGQCRVAAGSAARGRRVVSPCRWLPLERGGR